MRISGIQGFDSGDLFGTRKDRIAKFVDIGGALSHRERRPGRLRLLSSFHCGSHIRHRAQRHAAQRCFIGGIDAFQPLPIAAFHQFTTDQHQAGHILLRRIL